MEQNTFIIKNVGPKTASLIVPGQGHVEIAVGEEKTITVDVGKPVSVTGNLAGGPGEPGDG